MPETKPRKLIPHFGEISENLHSVKWDLGGREAFFQSKLQIKNTAYCPEHNLVLILLAEPGERRLTQLVGLEANGQERFRQPPPKGYTFYYLASHVNYSAAVVCISTGHELDWYFAITPESGELLSLNRAY